MFAAAERSGRLLVEAFPYRSQPQTHALAQLIASGEIGRPRMIQASFGFPVANPTNIRLDPGLGGGALLDAGTYAVSLIRLLAGEKPNRVSAFATWTDRGVDRTLVANIEFPSGLLAQAACSFGTGIYRRALIACENGVAETDFLNSLTQAMPGRLTVSRGGWEPTTERLHFDPSDGFVPKPKPLPPRYALARRRGTASARPNRSKSWKCSTRSSPVPATADARSASDPR